MEIRKYLPTWRARSVPALSRDFLLEQGIDLVALDVDNSISPRDNCSVEEGTVDHIFDLKACGIKVCLVSNAWQSRRVAAIAWCRLGVDYVIPGLRPDRWKPSSWCIDQAVRRAGTIHARTIMVGDQLSDIRAARRAGCSSVLLDPLDPNDYHFLTKMWKLPKQYSLLAEMERLDVLPPYIEDIPPVSLDLIGREPPL